jgi:hypothetical protein
VLVLAKVIVAVALCIGVTAVDVGAGAAVSVIAGVTAGEALQALHSMSRVVKNVVFSVRHACNDFIRVVLPMLDGI